MYSLGNFRSSDTTVCNIALIKYIFSITYINTLGDGGTVILNSKACIWREKNEDENYWQIPCNGHKQNCWVLMHVQIAR